MINGLTPKEIVELRIKCLEPFVATGSKVGLEKMQVIECAEAAWQYAIKPIEKKPAEDTRDQSRPSTGM